MKVKAPSLLKKIMAALSNKTNELRIRFMIFFLLHKNMDRTTLTHSLSNELHALVPPTSYHPKKKNDDVLEDGEEEEEEEKSKAANLLMYYNKVEGGGTHPNPRFGLEENNFFTSYNGLDFLEKHSPSSQTLLKSVVEDVPRVEEEEEDNLTHELFRESEAALEEEEEVEEGGGGVAADLEEVAAEDIDQAADLFIKRFKRQIQLQKLHSLDRHQQRMLEANV